eukprot:4986458-Alexandrium_andersonii.AAC.1
MCVRVCVWVHPSWLIHACGLGVIGTPLPRRASHELAHECVNLQTEVDGHSSKAWVSSEFVFWRRIMPKQRA